MKIDTAQGSIARAVAESMIEALRAWGFSVEECRAAMDSFLDALNASEDPVVDARALGEFEGWARG